jgi:hypothetical protein
MYIRKQRIDHLRNDNNNPSSRRRQLFTTANPITATCFDSHQAFFRMYTMICQLKHVAVFEYATVREVFVRCVCMCVFVLVLVFAYKQATGSDILS